MWWCREKLAATETKLKAAVQDKTNVGIEKAALERELKGLRGQAGRLTKVPSLPALPAHLSLSRAISSLLHLDSSRDPSTLGRFLGLSHLCQVVSPLGQSCSVLQ